ncbi:MAG: hypothetical protein CMA63_06185 [Euryarchaeota archaeon]|nr:hypothetical protein [Euryarchaeota archaeon]|tara:strand:+ start:7477 stop:7827 length:351 start_codon:yes stop_codon:yes gene_type:complete
MRPIVKNYLTERTTELVRELRDNDYVVSLYDDEDDYYYSLDNDLEMTNEILWSMDYSQMIVSKESDDISKNTGFLMIPENEMDIVSDWAPADMRGDKELNLIMETYMNDLEENIFL